MTQFCPDDAGTFTDPKKFREWFTKQLPRLKGFLSESDYAELRDFGLDSVLVGCCRGLVWNLRGESPAELVNSLAYWSRMPSGNDHWESIYKELPRDWSMPLAEWALRRV